MEGEMKERGQIAVATPCFSLRLCAYLCVCEQDRERVIHRDCVNERVCVSLYEREMDKNIERFVSFLPFSSVPLVPTLINTISCAIIRGYLAEMKATKQFKKLGPKVKDKITAAKLMLDKEKIANLQEMERLFGQPIVYGKTVQLRHVTSGLFLTVQRTAASVDRGALKLVLSTGHGASCFQISSGDLPPTPQHTRTHRSASV